MFKMIDTDNSGQITLEELQKGLEKVGANLMESEINDLLESVSVCCNLICILSHFLKFILTFHNNILGGS